MVPKIENVVYKCLKGVQDSMEQKNNCFEIYGVDIILDEVLNPWIIEVNLSPACNERTVFLTKMLDDMSFDLISHLDNKLIV
jgi:D-alanine-D-alanine ligase-like ATP-grasp enzyme